MSVKKRNKRFMTAQEKHLRRMMIDHQVSIGEIAQEMDIDDPSVISHRFARLTPSSYEEFKDVILSISHQRVPQKVAS